MKFPWKVKKKIETPADEQIENIKAILFPPLVTQQEMQKDGTQIKFHIDYSADSNLDAALMDLQEGHNDPATHKTILDVVKRLNKLRTMLEAYAEFDKDAKYIIVENYEQDKEFGVAENNI
jgi:hypothetical protein